VRASIYGVITATNRPLYLGGNSRVRIPDFITITLPISAIKTIDPIGIVYAFGNGVIGF
jgi:hypothetical protein